MAAAEKPEKPFREIAAQYTVAQAFDKFGKGVKINLILHESFVEFRSVGKEPVKAKLDYKNIMHVEYGARSEIVKAKKSVVVRAVEGYLLAGKTGAMVGTASAMQHGGTANKQVTLHYMIIGFYGKDKKENYIGLVDQTRRDGKVLAERLKELACFPGNQKEGDA